MRYFEIINEGRIPLDREGNELVDYHGKPIPTNNNGTITLYHWTSEDAAKKIAKTGRFISKENTNETFFSNKPDSDGGSGFGDYVVEVEVSPNRIRVPDMFPSGEIYAAVSNRFLSARNVKRIYAAPESINESAALTWTYNLTVKDQTRFVVNCHSNSGDTVEGFIFFQGGNNLVWDVNRREMKAIQERHGKTGLMRPITAAIHEALGIYLEDKHPPFVVITGRDTNGKRQTLYASWTAWHFSGYQSESIENGVGFVRDGVVPPWRKR